MADLIGRVGVCARGRLGLIEGWAISGKFAKGHSWVGTGVLDDRPWASRDPTMLEEGQGEALLSMVEGQ